VVGLFMTPIGQWKRLDRVVVECTYLFRAVTRILVRGRGSSGPKIVWDASRPSLPPFPFPSSSFRFPIPLPPPMTYTLSGGALNSTQTKPNLPLRSRHPSLQLRLGDLGERSRVPGRFVPMHFRSRERKCRRFVPGNETAYAIVTFVLINCRLLVSYNCHSVRA